MTEKFSYKKGFKGFESDDSDFLKEGGTSPWDAAGDRGSDATGVERGAQSQGEDDAAFLKASQSRTLPGTSRSVESIYSDVMSSGGPGPFGDGGGPVTEVGGNTARRRYSPTSSKTARDRQNNGGV